MDKKIEFQIQAVALFKGVERLISEIPRELTQQESDILDRSRKLQKRFMRELKLSK